MKNQWKPDWVIMGTERRRNSFWIILLVFSTSQNEYYCRLDFLWKKKFKKEREEIETMENLNRVLLENVLPAHVAQLFIGQNLRNEVRQEAYYPLPTRHPSPSTAAPEMLTSRNGDGIQEYCLNSFTIEFLKILDSPVTSLPVFTGSDANTPSPLLLAAVNQTLYSCCEDFSPEKDSV